MADINSVEPETAEARVTAARAKLVAIRDASTLDDKLGLTPKAMAALRWKLVETAAPAAPQVAELDDRRQRLTG